MTKLDRAKAATVRLPGTGSRGVLVAGGFVLTATHCIGWDGTSGLTLGDHHRVPVEADGLTVRLQPYFADAVSDMAALGEPDDQVFPEDAQTFEAWRERTKEIALSPWVPKARTPRSLARLARLKPQEVGAHVLSLAGGWVNGCVAYHGFGRPGSRVALKVEAPLKGGMSGGPVVDDQGRLLGVVSWGAKDGVIPLASLALPTWISDRIRT
jgi:Trypsin-like peptidase domain